MKEQNCWYLKTWSNGIQRSGIPDIIACINGWFIGIEVKAENGKISELQKHEIKTIHEANGIAIVLFPDQFEEFKELVECLKEDEYLYACWHAGEINKKGCKKWQ